MENEVDKRMVHIADLTKRFAEYHIFYDEIKDEYYYTKTKIEK